jgi:biopolymer transport protein ExbD
MRTHAGEIIGPIVVFATLWMAQRVLQVEYADSRGTSVFLPRNCTQKQLTQRGDWEAFAVRYRLDHSSFVNESFMPVQGDLRREIATRMSTRNEQVTWFSADERLTYGEVSEILSDLQKEDPALHLILITGTQVGPVGDISSARIDKLCL